MVEPLNSNCRTEIGAMISVSLLPATVASDHKVEGMPASRVIRVLICDRSHLWSAVTSTDS